MNSIVHDEIAKHSKVVHGDPPASLIGIGMGAPVVLTYATTSRRSACCRDLLGRGDLVPDVLRAERGLRRGGLATRAVRDGDDWIVNGQKVWTTVAHLATWGMLLARTNPDVPKHDGSRTSSST
jgi:alkylation response protein AidB-like acyl-CoA dehydrogenase